MDDSLAIALLKYETSEDHILDILKKINYSKEPCKYSVLSLKLNEKSTEDLLALMKKTGYAHAFCKICVSFLDLDKMPEEKEIVDIIKNSKYNSNALEAFLPFLHSVETVLDLMNKEGYSYRICDVGAQRLKVLSKKK